jgi:hypothetical protein
MSRCNLAEVEKLYDNPLFQAWVKDLWNRHYKFLKQGGPEAFHRAEGVIVALDALERMVNHIVTETKKARE